MADFRGILDRYAEDQIGADSVRSWIDDALAEHQYTAAELLEILGESSLDESRAAPLLEHLEAALRQEEEAGREDPLDIDISDLSLAPIEDESAREAAGDKSAERRDKDGAAASEESFNPGDSLSRLRRQAVEEPAESRPAEADRETDGPEQDTGDRADDDAPPTEYAPPPRNPAEEPTLIADENRQDTGIAEADTRPHTDATTGGSLPGSQGRREHRNIGPGTILKERFELVTAIGEGGMGTVYKARDLLKVEAKDRNPYMAVKLLTGDFREHPEAFIALQRESSKAQRLAHPNIATVYDFDRDGSTVFMTMELLEGQELSKYIKKLPPGGLPPKEGLEIIRQLCEGLAYAHNRGLVHSDLKPGNAYITRDGTVKLLDFGIARASKTRADASGETTLFDPGQLGALTPAYATIEMFEGEEPDPRDDIYALACIGYELLSGKHPFNKLSAVKVKEKGLAPSPIPKLTKRQNRALFRALALTREERVPSVEEFWEELRPRKDYTLPLTIGGGAALLLLGLFTYVVVIPWIERQQHESLIENVTAQGPEAVPALLESLPQYAPEARRFILEGAKDTVIRYYDQQAEALVDPARGRHDYPAALALINELLKLYPDSAQVNALRDALEARRNTLIAEQTRLFDEYLEQGRLLPLEDEADITDVVAVLRQAAPDNPLLNDARLTTRYAEMARAAVRQNDYARAARILEVALAYSAQDPALVNLNDQVQRELARRAEAERVAELKRDIDAVRSSLQDLRDYLPVRDALLELARLRPEDPLLRETLADIGQRFDARLAGLIAASEWETAEKLLFDFAPLLPTQDLLAKREMLSFAEVRNSYQPASLSERLDAIQQQRAAVRELLEAGRFDEAWHAELLREFRELAALLRPGSLWFDELRRDIGLAYVARARELLQNNRFDAAGRWLGLADDFAPPLEQLAGLRGEIADAERAFQAAEAERIRQARIAALKNQLQVQAEAGEVRQAEATLEQLRKMLSADDDYLQSTGPALIARAYLDLAAAQAREENFGNALTFARRAAELAPGLSGIEETVADYRKLAERQNLMRAAEQATPDSLSALPGRLDRVQDLFPQDATAIENRMLDLLAERIRALEDYDAVLANRLLEQARSLFPGSRQLANLRLKPPPTPSRHVPEGRQALQAGELSRATEILETARREEPGNEQVQAFATELENAKADANRYYLAYQQNLRAGRREQARVYLEEALRRWSDNERFQSEYQANFAATRAPGRAADGSRPCTPQLAGYGAQGRAECFDMVVGREGPTLVVIPAGGGRETPYAMGKYEISVGDYNHFCRQTGCAVLPGEAGRPATGISIAQAEAYLAWLSRETGKSYRMPTAGEWTHAARAGDPAAVRDFNCRVTQGGQILKGVSLLDVRTGRENPWGLVNYVGNVQEWVRDGRLTVRGGNYTDSLSECGISLARPHDGSADSLTGFRVLRELGGDG